ncbi:MAG: 2-oxoglutarate/2-oxoacid ferredoxin oxidoreductase subunit alpha [Clostridia bacterium]|jgi:2-oxoglutarate ferredoxin oxidoreductase subunit alpha|nr:3-methyl-2-oxobutanoate dehydrogenase (ferredoxin) [Clostridiales bacterium]MDK2984572.1 2-oxoglutarate/2-oxoacid ferredoxin oxidoreductase subunit alpha [Clostridia bacterium]
MTKMLMKGNEAIAEAAIRSGCKLFFGYPITPSTEIPEYMSKKLKEVGGTFLQAESEVAAINMVYGASATGVRVMTASSSPGYSLKQEGLSYLAAVELPAVIVDIMRAGPGLGGLGPTQADYFQITKGGGHGDYHPIVLAPATVQEMVDLTMEAFDLADEYRTPVVIAADGILGQMMEPVEFPKGSSKDLPHKDWAATGAKGREKVNVSNYCLTNEIGERNCLHLQKKHEYIKPRVQRWKSYKTEDAEFIIVAFGTSGRISETAVDLARKEGIKLGLIRPITLWPFPEKAFEGILDQVKGFMSVELSTGQMIEDVRLVVNGKVPVKFFGKQGGMTPAPEEIVTSFKAQFGLE